MTDQVPELPPVGSAPDTERPDYVHVGNGVLYAPPGAKTPPCPFPCSICVRKGRQQTPATEPAPTEDPARLLRTTLNSSPEGN